MDSSMEGSKRDFLIVEAWSARHHFHTWPSPFGDGLLENVEVRKQGLKLASVDRDCAKVLVA